MSVHNERFITQDIEEFEFDALEWSRVDSNFKEQSENFLLKKAASSEDSTKYVLGK